MKKWAFISLSLAVFSAIGCSIEVNEGHDDWNDDGWSDETARERAQDACQPYCLRLIGCEVLSDSSFSACTDLCEERFLDNEDEVASGCSCVSSAQCDVDDAQRCDGDPIPDVWTDGDDALGGGNDDTSGDDDDPAPGGQGGASGDQDGPTCEVNHECAAGEDCVEGQCLARCAASCQCRDGMACEEGYCQTPEEPAAECEDTCDCTAGDVCVDGTCQ